MKIQGQVAFITGGCSGLGLQTAKNLISKGCKVVLVDRDQEAGEKLQKSMAPDATFIKADVRLQEDIKKAFEIAISKHKSIRIFLFCAGVAIGSHMISKSGKLHPTALFQTTIDINLVGTFLCAKYAANHMITLDAVGERARPERGVIITVSSSLAEDGPRHFTAYSASKAAIMGMMVPMARDLGKYSIRVVSIAPALIRTAMTEGSDQRFYKLAAQQTALGRLQSPQQFAHMAESVVENSFLNAVTIRTHGGLMTPNL